MTDQNLEPGGGRALNGRSTYYLLENDTPYHFSPPVCVPIQKKRKKVTLECIHRPTLFPLNLRGQISARARTRARDFSPFLYILRTMDFAKLEDSKICRRWCGY